MIHEDSVRWDADGKGKPTCKEHVVVGGMQGDYSTIQVNIAKKYQT